MTRDYFLSLFAKFQRKDSRRRKQHVRDYHRRLGVERLEDRQMLSITVNTLADENDGVGVGGTSLRDAIAAATPGEIINFSVAGTINLTHGDLSISKNLTISGPGANALTIDASGNDPTPNVNNRDGSRIFLITGAVDVSISGLRLTGGDAGADGGAIFAGSVSSLSLLSMTIENNASSAGGGVFFDSFTASNKLTIGNSIIRDNEAIFIDEASGGGRGGGLYITTGGLASGVDIFNSTIEDNTAGENGGGVWLLDLCDARTADLRIRDSIISGNQAAGDGGGIWALLQPYISDLAVPGKLLIERTTIANNTAKVFGGGLSLDADVRDATSGVEVIRIDSSTISGNVAYGGGTTEDGIRGLGGGGGLRLLGTRTGFTTMTINNSTISGNRALNGGGMYINPVSQGSGTKPWIRHTTIAFNIAGPFDSVEYPDAPFISTVQQPTGGGGILFGGIFGAGFGDQDKPNNNTAETVSFDHSIVARNVHLINEAADHDHSNPPDGILDNDNGLNISHDFGVSPQPSDFLEPHSLGEPLGSPFYTFSSNYSIFGDLGPSFHAWNIFDLVGTWLETDPLLDNALADNGGTTLTHTLLPGSPAIDAGDPAAVAGVGPVPLYDQRGNPFTRVYNDRIDIGAIEVQPIPEEPCPVGDYNDNGVVDAADYTVWRDRLGSNSQLPNEDPAVTPGMVTSEDYEVWVAHFGEICVEMGSGQSDIALPITIAGPLTIEVSLGVASGDTDGTAVSPSTTRFDVSFQGLERKVTSRSDVLRGERQVSDIDKWQSRSRALLQYLLSVPNPQHTASTMDVEPAGIANAEVEFANHDTPHNLSGSQVAADEYFGSLDATAICNLV